METKDKLALIREYLSVAFPYHPIYYRWDSSRVRIPGQIEQ